MELIICEDEQDFSRAVSDWCKTKIEFYQAKSIFVPAGKTPESFYAFLEAHRPGYLQAIKLFQIDDVLSGPSKNCFQKFFAQHLPSYGCQFKAIEGADESADLAILGLGLNGHVAFHEPEIHASFYSGCVPLSEQTCKTLSLDVGAWGVSYGIAAFLQTKALLLIVKGNAKQVILQDLLKNETQLPAGALLKHHDITIIADRAAFPR